MVRILLCFVMSGVVAWALSPDDMKLLQDAGGWEYQTITDANNGFQTQAVCFDKAMTGQCRGNLLFRADNSFRQTISAHGSSMNRGGRYQVDGNSLTFFDEFDHQDGPYTIRLNADEKTLHLEAARAGVQMDLLLEREFRKRMQDKDKKK